MKNAIVIPCYNEAARLPVYAFQVFLASNDECFLAFSNDGSTDATLEVLGKIKDSAPERVKIINLSENKGKAEAVRQASLSLLEEMPSLERIGYLDADLSTSLEEWAEISQKVTGDVVFAFGARLAKIDTYIRRKPYRHYIGRFVATMISLVLDITVYDTQCGCKVIRADVAKKVFDKPFLSRWLFDVEIFFRISQIFGKPQIPKICREIPLEKWEDVNDSKVGFSYMFRLWYDLFLIHREYNGGK